ncbi:hypothetical protein HPCPY6081_0571 [Helicobacter pylori CPY6081]|nr:hypothetical protein HPCPY6081_0571 [Helicobacter pylori CPY6081]
MSDPYLTKKESYFITNQLKNYSKITTNYKNFHKSLKSNAF